MKRARRRQREEQPHPTPSPSNSSVRRSLLLNRILRHRFYIQPSSHRHEKSSPFATTLFTKRAIIVATNILQASASEDKSQDTKDFQGIDFLSLPLHPCCCKLSLAGAKLHSSLLLSLSEICFTLLAVKLFPPWSLR